MNKQGFAFLTLLLALLGSVVPFSTAVAQDCPVGTTGDDTITNTSDCLTNIDGLAGNDTITNATDTYATAIDGNEGNDIIANNGEVVAIIGGDGDDQISTTGTTGIVDSGAGDDTITNTGNNIILASGEGNDVVNNSGTTFGIASGGENDIVNNSGDVAIIDVETGDDMVSNSGFVELGILAGEGNDVIHSSGEVILLIDGGSGDDQITNSGDVGGYIFGYDGNDTLTNSGTVGSDPLASGLLDFPGGIYGEDGDDTVILQTGAVVVGMIDGGTGTDTLTFDMELTFNTQEEADAYAAQFAAQLAAQLPESGSITLDGTTYTWTNFEQLNNLLRYIALLGAHLKDGRVNNFDLGAPLAGYCKADGSFEVWDIGTDGHGVLAFSVSAEQIASALASHTNVLIAEGMGDSLYALADGNLQVMGPDLREPEKAYSFVFAPCTP